MSGSSTEKDTAAKGMIASMLAAAILVFHPPGYDGVKAAFDDADKFVAEADRRYGKTWRKDF